MNLGPYAGFIVAAYAMAAITIAALITWVWVDYRTQKRTLAEFEARGITRRSERVNPPLP